MFCLDVKNIDKLPITRIDKKAFQGVFPEMLFLFEIRKVNLNLECLFYLNLFPSTFCYDNKLQN